MKERIKEILQDVRPDIDFDEEKHLVSEGVFSSIDIITLIAALEDEYDIQIPIRLIVADKFDSVDVIVNLVNSLIEA